MIVKEKLVTLRHPVIVWRDVKEYRPAALYVSRRGVAAAGLPLTPAFYSVAPADDRNY